MPAITGFRNATGRGPWPAPTRHDGLRARLIMERFGDKPAIKKAGQPTLGRPA